MIEMLCLIMGSIFLKYSVLHKDFAITNHFWLKTYDDGLNIILKYKIKYI